ncbi:hypothetical protein NGRA_2574 [Nosema granulosis]|uniref:Uncharacterized protein n=1 Tax=Nosema granulosis TaxID=83296 RepID=A0A9P6GXF3_9MICR|nr:hypothetical protein NGRA_2574 [Nosema granulosis]
MRNLLYYALFTCILLALGDNPYFYDKALENATYNCVSDCFKTLYKPINRITIDKRAVYRVKSVVFLDFDPCLRRFIVGIDDKPNYWKIFYYKEEHRNPIVEKDLKEFVLWAISNIKEIIKEEEVYIYFTISKNQSFNNYLYETVETFSTIIRDTLQKELPLFIDIKYHPEDLETFIGTKHNVYNGCLETLSISLEHDNYIFMVFLHNYFFNKVKEQLRETINELQDKQIEDCARKYLNKSLKEASEQEMNDLFVLSMFDNLRDSLENNKISSFQEKLLIKIVKYFINKKDFQKYFFKFFDKNSKSSIYINNVKKVLKIFETEKAYDLKEIGLDFLNEESIGISQKILLYLNNTDEKGLKSGKFIADILVFLSYDIDTLSKILLSKNIKQNNDEKHLRKSLLDQAQKYWMGWIDSYIKYTQGEIEDNHSSLICDFESLRNSCIAFAVDNNLRENVVSSYFVEMADIYFKKYSFGCVAGNERTRSPGLPSFKY